MFLVIVTYIVETDSFHGEYPVAPNAAQKSDYFIGIVGRRIYLREDCVRLVYLHIIDKKYMYILYQL